MAFTTTARMTEPKDIHIPSSVPETRIYVSTATFSEEKAHEEAFRRLKGIAGCELDLNQIREERLQTQKGEAAVCQSLLANS